MRVRLLWALGHHFHQLTQNLVLFVFLFKDILFNISCFINTAFIANSTITHIWMILSNTSTFSVWHMTIFLHLGRLGKTYFGRYFKTTKSQRKSAKTENMILRKKKHKLSGLLKRPPAYSTRLRREAERWDGGQSTASFKFSWEWARWAATVSRHSLHIHKWPQKCRGYWFGGYN